MQNGLISVILPIWKPNLSHLKTCIDSVVAQTYSDIEIIIIYKKSLEFDDAFYRLIKEYRDDKIKVVEDNSGLSDALNAGITKSTGEFIARIDSDDFCEIDRFERQLKFKENHKCNVVGSLANYISNVDKKIAKIYALQFFRKYQKAWNEQIFCFHDFKHPQYNTPIKKMSTRFSTDLND